LSECVTYRFASPRLRSRSALACIQLAHGLIHAQLITCGLGGEFADQANQDTIRSCSSGTTLSARRVQVRNQERTSHLVLSQRSCSQPAATPAGAVAPGRHEAANPCRGISGLPDLAIECCEGSRVQISSVLSCELDPVIIQHIFGRLARNAEP